MILSTIAKAFSQIHSGFSCSQACPYYEKLDEMMATSERQLVALLGPDLPTTSTTTSTTTTSPVTSKLAREEDLLEDIQGTVRLEEKVIDEAVSVVYYFCHYFFLKCFVVNTVCLLLEEGY